MSNSNIPQLLNQAIAGSFPGGFDMRRFYTGPSEFVDSDGSSYLNWGTAVVRIPSQGFVGCLQEAGCEIVDNWDQLHYFVKLFPDMQERIVECSRLVDQTPQPNWFRWANSSFQEDFATKVAQMRALIPDVEIYIVLLSNPWKLAHVSSEPLNLN
jgi:hypothetical protein